MLRVFGLSGLVEGHREGLQGSTGVSGSSLEGHTATLRDVPGRVHETEMPVGSRHKLHSECLTSYIRLYTRNAHLSHGKHSLATCAVFGI